MAVIVLVLDIRICLWENNMATPQGEDPFPLA